MHNISHDLNFQTQPASTQAWVMCAEPIHLCAVVQGSVVGILLAGYKPHIHVCQRLTFGIDMEQHDRYRAPCGCSYLNINPAVKGNATLPWADKHPAAYMWGD
jgi:hypothetical protein